MRYNALKISALILLASILLFFSACSANNTRLNGELAAAIETSEAQKTHSTESSAAPEQPSISVDVDPQSTQYVMDSNVSQNISNGMAVTINGNLFTINLEDNEIAAEFADMVRGSDLSIEMSDYGGFEKVGSLGKNLTSDNVNMTTLPGDIVLYNGNQIVMFYGSNTWDYTKLGSIEDLTGWDEALGDGDVTAVFSMNR